MEKFGDDEVASVLKWVEDPNDRKSLPLVCKQWLRVEGFCRLSLRLFEPNFLPHFLPRFPNLLKFESSEIISNSQLDFIANTCPEIQVLNLNYKENVESLDEIPNLIDFDDHGVSAIAKGCCNLSTVLLRRRVKVGNLGVVSLANFSRNLVNLNLGWCSRITDEALEAIGKMRSLRTLNLQGCSLITDLGLALLAQGPLCNSLIELVLAECDRITDKGVISLTKIKCLKKLDLAECGLKVTDIGGMAIAGMKSLRRLNLSWLINVMDITIAALAKNCQKLLDLDLTGCESVTGNGIFELRSHKCLRNLVLTGILDFTGDDLQLLVFECKSLRCITLDRRLRMWISTSVQEKVLRQHCEILWKT